MESDHLAGHLTPTPDRLPPPPSRSSLLLPRDLPVDRSIRRLESVLGLLGFPLSSAPLDIFLSVGEFLVLGVAFPSAAVFLLSRCDGSRIERFDVVVLVSQGVAAAISLVCVSRNLLKYGIRRLLFVSERYGRVDRFQKEYIRKIQDFFLLSWWILPCFLVKTACEIYRFIYISHESVWRSVAASVASITSWTYLTTIYLSSCTFFNLICNVQIVHLEDYGKILEQDADTLMYVEEHLQLRYNLSKISHRFRIFLLLLFVSVTASQFVILFETTGYGGTINFTIAGDLAVSRATSFIQVAGVVLYLHAAAKISHRAQGIASLASRWHALVTCSSSDPTLTRCTNSSENLEAFPANLLRTDYSESDVESFDNLMVHKNSQLASFLPYHKRNALVMYLMSNPGGITIFGLMVGRALVSTIFSLELTLVLFVLGETMSVSS
ncbi:uncharacterized protein [Typha latifolia]|uniref:uncharacterized protein isoform X1 n=1 Tax=Typha latifolia TaxID=4733 RepID=UPI003C2F096F